MKQPDQQVRKTVNLLHQALMELIIEKKSYEAIIVQNILDRANVGRSTFYTHFVDKDALLLHGLQNLKQMLHSCPPAAGDSPAKALLSFSAPMFAHAQDHRDVYLAVLGSPTGFLIMREIENNIREVLTERFDPLIKTRQVTCHLPKELFLHYLASSFCAVMGWWMEHHPDIPWAEMDAHYFAFVSPAWSRSSRPESWLTPHPKPGERNIQAAGHSALSNFRYQSFY